MPGAGCGQADGEVAALPPTAPRPARDSAAARYHISRMIDVARLAEAARLLQQAEAIIHRLWQEESDRGGLAPDILDLLQQTANEIEQAAGTLAQVSCQPDAGETGGPA